MKKLFIVLGIIFSLGIISVSYFTFLGKNNVKSKNNICAFCNPEVLKTHTFYEDDLVRGLCSYKPVFPGHCLVVTKRHIKSFKEVSDEEMIAIASLIKKINDAIQKIMGPSIYLIQQKNGSGIQSVPHLHFHYIPRKDDKSHPVWIGLDFLWKFCLSLFKSPMSKEELASCVEKMKMAI
ncbi:HIT domain-containing protein [Candidatus Dependentiae bacterium]|nr:HIT domain-containing protein [Candidatus Dependentiae bacterium]